MTTKHEAIKIDNNKVVSLLSPDAVRSTPNATHVVVAIQWGAVAIAMLKCSNEENEDKTEVEAALKAKLACLEIGATGQGSISDTSTSKLHGFEFEFFIDALPNGDDVPQTVEQAVSFMKKLPALVANANGGKGTPICYTLLPLSAFKYYLGAIDSLNQIKSIDGNAIEEAVQIFDEMNQSQRVLNEIHEDFEKYSFCITDDAVQNVFQRLQLIKATQTNIKEQLHKAIVDIRHGRSDAQAIFSITRDYHNQSASRTAVKTFINSLMSLWEKINYAAYIQKKGAHYIGKGVSLESKRMKHNSSECYIFFCSWNQPQGLVDNKRYFNSLIEEKKFSCFLVDIDSQPEVSKREGVDGGNRICLFSDGEYISNDCFGEYTKDKKKCLVKCTQKRTKTTEKPNKRVDVDLICPKSLKGRYCSKDMNEWFCADCRERLQYDFNHSFLCDCGSAPINTFQFRCPDPKHGMNFIGFSDNKYLTNLVKQLRPKEINILILGETGVGKSTWINGFANYLTFQTLKEAEKGRQIYLVPSQFTITDSDGKIRDIQVGKAENESFDVGASSTQKPKSYVFNVGKKTIRLIDTPGIGDCRGADQDALNFSSILQYIANFSDIHGICILLKPNNSRMNIVFKYCINELLTHLHVSAAQNIAFCFTNARGTFYRPGDTLPILKKFLGDLETNRGVEISLSKGTTYYCMDNESFRFLCCLHEGEKFAEEEHKNFEQSWTLAVRETETLLSHFEKDVDPHIVGQTVSLNETRKLILMLAKPLADISQIIQDNISEVNTKKDMITKLDARDIDLKKHLMITQIGFETKRLNYPRTVCTGTNCVEIQTLPNSNTKMTIYKTICHGHCGLDGIVPETCPCQELQNCAAMDRSSPSNVVCSICKCSWSVHIHIKFEQIKVNITIKNPVTEQLLQQNLTSKEKQECLIKVFIFR
ncbi:hypothetical protein WR25_16820 isoform B [Diploscapter pachys]|uniref:Uncharacterized protein n=1 Tax=Diploscapter pachys TaxID=2018661 RepID=A0A2A2KPS7_9BILA|nr:hypothetical protein WR25_16820 isoform B [Diploscapter pachys]